MNVNELGLSVINPKRLPALEAASREAVLAYLDDPQLASLLPPEARLTHLYFGSEYCEHLFPEAAAIDAAVALASRLGLRFVLATPIASDALIDRLCEAVPRLPGDAEVVVNDWGVASLLQRSYPHLGVVAGRQLAKMMKDPRVPTPTWLKVYPSNYRSAPYAEFLQRLGIGRVELDVPPFATPDLFEVDGVGVSVWAPFAYIAKGRICKIGSLRQAVPEKFAPGRPCHHECLGILESEPAASPGLRTYSRGTTMFYRHDAAMLDVVRDATERGLISRLVLSEV